MWACTLEFHPWSFPLSKLFLMLKHFFFHSYKILVLSKVPCRSHTSESLLVLAKVQTARAPARPVVLESLGAIVWNMHWNIFIFPKKLQTYLLIYILGSYLFLFLEIKIEFVYHKIHSFKVGISQQFLVYLQSYITITICQKRFEASPMENSVMWESQQKIN